LGLSPIRLLIIAVVGLLLLGPDKLPQVARQAGALWHTLRTLSQRVEDEIREVAPDLPRSADLARYARSPVSLLNQLADRAKAEADAAAAPADGDPTPQDPEATVDGGGGDGFAPPGVPVADPDRPAPAWGDPSLN
jgi:sec-independent protein translocase protein TatB